MTTCETCGGAFDLDDGETLGDHLCAPTTDDGERCHCGHGEDAHDGRPYCYDCDGRPARHAYYPAN